MREKYILRAGHVGAEPDAWILGIYYTPSPSKFKRVAGTPRKISRRVRIKRGTLTIGGPKGFSGTIDDVLMTFFGVAKGLEDDRVHERQEGIMRKRFVCDVHPISLHAFRFGVRRMRETGITATSVNSTGRLMR